MEDLYTAVWYEQVLEDYFLLLEWFDGLEYMEEEYLEDSGDESFETVIDMDDAEEFKDKGVFDKEDDQEHIVKDVLVPVLEPVFYIKKEYIVLVKTYKYVEMAMAIVKNTEVIEIINPSKVFEEPHVIPAIKEVADRVSSCQEKDLANAHA